MKKVSVIIPVYNVSEYLEECLDSIVKQSIGLSNIEVIIINDGSTDNSIDIIKKYIKKYPDWIVIDRENKGLSISRNEGVEKSSAEYVTFLDSDDYLDKDALNVMYKYAKKEKSDILIARMKAFDSKGIYKYYSDKFIKDYRTFSLIENKKILKVISVCSKLYKRSFLKNIKFIPNIGHEDNNFTMSVYTKAKRITTIPEYCYYRRYREGENSSFMQTLSIKTFNDLVENYILFFKENEKNNLVVSFSLRLFNNYIISRLPKDDKKNARRKIKDYLLTNKTLNRYEVCYYDLYQRLYYNLAGVYYQIIKK